MSAEPPLILAVASGKGGVGKTMLTVACAHELSLQKRTLLVDLDFFNRGLTGLLTSGKDFGAIVRPAFLGEDPTAAERWRVREVAPDLLYIWYPDLLPEEIARLEALDALAMRDSLRDFIRRVAADFQCRAVVLDCHGGPDRTSFAAAFLADHTLLISEPDRITFHGTLNFLRQLERVAPTGTPFPDIRLVFNKVIPALRAGFLYRVYDKYLREDFAGSDLLAIFPLEVYLTKAFEETPVLTALYPHSLLARKMRLLLRDLLGSTRAELLAPGIRCLNPFARRYRRRTLGKMPWFLELQSVFVALGVLTVCLLPLFFLKSQYAQHREEAQTVAQEIALGVALQDPEFQKELAAASPDVRERMRTTIAASNELPSKKTYVYSPSYRFLRENVEVGLLLDRVPWEQTADRLFGENLRWSRDFDRRLALMILGQTPIPDNFTLGSATRARERLLELFSDRRMQGSLVAYVITEWIQVPAFIAGAWVLFVALAGYQSRLDTNNTRAVRAQRYVRASWTTFGILVAWSLPLYLCGATLNYFAHRRPDNTGDDTVGSLWAGTLLGIGLLFLVAKQLWLLWRVANYERCRRESVWRMLVLGFLLILFFVLKQLAQSVFYGS